MFRKILVLLFLCLALYGRPASAQFVTIAAPLQVAATTTGNGTVMDVTGLSGVGLTVNCVETVGTMTFYIDATSDGTNWTPIAFRDTSGSLGPVGAWIQAGAVNTYSVTTVAQLYVPLNGGTYTGLRFRINTIGATVTVDVTGTGSDVPPNFPPSLSAGATFRSPATVSITNVATSCAVANAARKGITVTNNTSTDCYLGDATVISGAAAGAGGGMLLRANGGSWTSEGTGVYTGAVYCITASGTAVVAVYER